MASTILTNRTGATVAVNPIGLSLAWGCDTNGYIAQWLERLTADQQVPGSNPGVPS